GSRRHSRSESTRCPSTASSAGRATTAAIPAMSATPTPAYANDRKNASGNTSNAASATATVSALKATDSPPGCTVRTTASGGARREVLGVARHDKQAVVDRQTETQAGREVEREDRHVRKRGDDEQDEEGPHDRQHADEQREAGGDDTAEHDDQEHQRDRERDELGAHEILLHVVVDLPIDLGESAHAHGDRPAVARVAG